MSDATQQAWLNGETEGALKLINLNSGADLRVSSRALVFAFGNREGPPLLIAT
jgi:hypothetical protein